jgi:hypothetical protein
MHGEEIESCRKVAEVFFFRELAVRKAGEKFWRLGNRERG